MKIIFDSEEQNNIFDDCFLRCYCPGILNLDESGAMTKACKNDDGTECEQCWEQAGLEMVVDEKKSSLDIIPRDVWERKRWEELAAAILRCVDKHHPIPNEWRDEYNELSVKVVDRVVKS